MEIYVFVPPENLARKGLYSVKFGNNPFSDKVTICTTKINDLDWHIE